MLRTTFLAAATVVLTLPAFAQDTTALATQYVNMPEVQQMMTDCDEWKT